MNVRSYRVARNYSPLDFPAIVGLGQTSINCLSEPFLIGDKVRLTINKIFLLTDMDTNKQYEVLTVQSIYEIPSNEIKSRRDVHEFYNDAVLGLNEVYKSYEAEMPALPSRSFPTLSIENYEGEIDRVFNLLNRRN